MKIVAVTTILEEPRILRVIEHLYNQGVDRIIASVEDQATLELINDEIWVAHRTKLPFDQGAEITRLAYEAADAGADWIIPFDADEYWCNLDFLSDISSEVDTIVAPMYLHTNPQYRAVKPKPLPKVIFRPRDDMTVSWGSHTVSGVTHFAQTSVYLRELQYESFDHFLAKIDKARRLHAQPHMNPENGSHMVRLTQMSPAELEAEWATHLATPTVYDPIPGSHLWT